MLEFVLPLSAESKNSQGNTSCLFLCWHYKNQSYLPNLDTSRKRHSQEISRSSTSKDQIEQKLCCHKEPKAQVRSIIVVKDTKNKDCECHLERPVKWQRKRCNCDRSQLTCHCWSICFDTKWVNLSVKQQHILSSDTSSPAETYNGNGMIDTFQCVRRQQIQIQTTFRMIDHHLFVQFKRVLQRMTWDEAGKREFAVDAHTKKI